jgi:hypothetical protein
MLIIYHSNANILFYINQQKIFRLKLCNKKSLFSAQAGVNQARLSPGTGMLVMKTEPFCREESGREEAMKISRFPPKNKKTLRKQSL